MIGLERGEKGSVCKDMFRFGVWTRDSIALGSATSQSAQGREPEVEQRYPLPVQRQRKRKEPRAHLLPSLKRPALPLEAMLASRIQADSGDLIWVCSPIAAGIHVQGLTCHQNPWDICS